MTKLFYTTGKQDIIETTYDLPKPTDDQIQVKAVLTGICTSDIEMYNGNFDLPKEMQGHEGLGEVVKIGKNICGVSIGDYVATRGEPAFADYYNVNKDWFIKVPEASPKYILEPVACAVNIVQEAKPHGRVLLLGTGFLATVVHTMLSHCDVTVVGSVERDQWTLTPLESVCGEFDCIIDLSPRVEYVKLYKHLAAGSKWVLATAKSHLELPMDYLLWKSVKVIFPSPRSKHFHNAMMIAYQLVRSSVVDVESFWKHEIARSDVVDAFSGAEYGRSYIKF